jgi:hypothetical protein
MGQSSLRAILEAYNVPDIEACSNPFLKSEHTTVRLPHSEIESAKFTFNTGVAQGSVLSPLLFSLFINTLSSYLTDIGIHKKIGHKIPGIQQFNHILFADDATLHCLCLLLG